MTDHADPVGLYVHIPFCRKKCDYCNFYVISAEHPARKDFIAALALEIACLQRPSVFNTIYFGGGSPSLLEPAEFQILLDAVHPCVHPVAEVTLEANPDDVTIEKLTAWKEGGVNRLSLGAQSFHNNELSALTRAYDSRQIVQAYDRARNAGIAQISLDLIFALPGSSRESWLSSLDQAIALEPDHISAYSLTVEAGTALFKQVEKGRITPLSDDHDRRQYNLAIDLLEAAGYEQYEISNFARPGSRSRHNWDFWSGCDYLGVGPSAEGYYDGQRYSNLPGIRPYVEALFSGQEVPANSMRLSSLDRACELAVLMLRRRDGINTARFTRLSGCRVEELFPAAIEQHLADSNVEWFGTNLRLTRRALPIADAVLSDFALPDQNRRESGLPT